MSQNRSETPSTSSLNGLAGGMNERELNEAWADMELILDDALDSWRVKRHDYRDAFLELGAKGQFSEIWRKVKKLKVSVWDGYDLSGESPAQVAKEIIPHCMMMVYLLDREGKE